MMRKSIKSVAVEVAGLSKVKVCSDFFSHFFLKILSMMISVFFFFF